MVKQKPKASIEQARAATERARQRTAQADGSEPEWKRAPLSWWRERWSDPKIRRLFIENFIYVRDAFDKNKLVLLKFNDVQADLHEKVTGRDVMLKFRRAGSSAYWRARAFANALINSGSRVRIVPQEPEVSEEFREDIRIMYENLPDHLRVKSRRWTPSLIWLNDKEKGTEDSRIRAGSVQPGHEGKGRGHAITDLVLTEVPFWRGDQRKAATALIEAAAGGTVAAESTAFGVDWFYSIYQDGKHRRGGWTAHFYEWWWKRDYRIEGAEFARIEKSWILLLPGESVDDFEFPSNGTGEEKADAYLRFANARLTSTERRIAIKILRHLKKLKYVPQRAPRNHPEVAEFLAWRRAKIGELPRGEQQFAVEYPENDRDCFEQTGRPVIPSRFLIVSCEPSGPIAGHSYVIGVDPSLGLESGDPAAICVIDVDHGRMAHLEILKVQPDLLAYTVGGLSDEYNSALIVVERNSIGIATIRKLIDLGYEEVTYRHLDARLSRAVDDGRLTIDEAMDQAQFGFPTTNESKPVGAMLLEEGIRKGWLGISSQAFCDEARTVVWFDNGTFGAQPGFHDDQFMATLIAWFVVKTSLGIFSGLGTLPEVGHAR